MSGVGTLLVVSFPVRFPAVGNRAGIFSLYMTVIFRNNRPNYIGEKP
jgi:hypothetical protein